MFEPNLEALSLAFRDMAFINELPGRQLVSQKRTRISPGYSRRNHSYRKMKSQAAALAWTFSPVQ